MTDSKVEEDKNNNDNVSIETLDENSNKVIKETVDEVDKNKKKNSSSSPTKDNTDVDHEEVKSQTENLRELLEVDENKEEPPAKTQEVKKPLSRTSSVEFMKTKTVLLQNNTESVSLQLSNFVMILLPGQNIGNLQFEHWEVWEGGVQVEGVSIKTRVNWEFWTWGKLSWHKIWY